jgi:hypothetical protein
MRPYLRSLFVLLLASGALLAGESAGLAQGYYGPAYGPPAPPPPSYRPAPRYNAPYYYEPAGHQGGLFVRLTAGLGYLYASETAGGASYHYSGLGGTASAAIGGVIAPNLILFGEILGTSAVDAEFTGGGSSGYPGVDVTLFGFGPGIAYYLEPGNVYLSATLAFSKLSFSNTNYDYYSYAEDTDLGIGGSFMVGKEWWVGRHLGMGVAGMLHLASMRDSYYDTRLTATAFSVLFSLSFN